MRPLKYTKEVVNRKTMLLAGCSILMSGMSGSLAQETTKSDRYGLEEIVVTSQKKK